MKQLFGHMTFLLAVLLASPAAAACTLADLTDAQKELVRIHDDEDSGSFAAALDNNVVRKINPVSGVIKWRITDLNAYEALRFRQTVGMLDYYFNSTSYPCPAGVSFVEVLASDSSAQFSGDRATSYTFPGGGPTISPIPCEFAVPEIDSPPNNLHEYDRAWVMLRTPSSGNSCGATQWKQIHGLIYHLFFSFKHSDVDAGAPDLVGFSGHSSCINCPSYNNSQTPAWNAANLNWLPSANAASSPAWANGYAATQADFIAVLRALHNASTASGTALP